MKRKLIRDNRLEMRIFQVRTVLLMTLSLVLMLLIFARFVQLQVMQHDEFSSRSEANRVRIRPIAPNRGLITDRNGTLLATNIPSYRLEITPEQVKKLDDTLARLADVIELDEKDLQRFHKLRKLRRSFQSTPVRYRLSEDEMARFAVKRHQFPGVEAVPYLSRHYPMGEAFAHVLGYIGQLDDRELAKLDRTRYRATTHIGKIGVEKYLEDRLHGEPGYLKVETNAQGRVLQVLEKSPPEHGREVQLSIDAQLQQSAYEALGNYTGAVVAIDPATGQVLALCSKPSYDPNLFVNGMDYRQYRDLVESPRKPLFNRAIQGGYEPGSTIKPFIALAGLHNELLNAEQKVLSTGHFQLNDEGRIYRDWKEGGHGRVDLEQAIAQSVNTYFYQLALELGINRIHHYLSPFGFGKTTGLDLYGELPGILPSREWKRAKYQLPWYQGETVIAGIGQGYFVVTPIQLAYATAMLAARGRVPVPHLRKDVVPVFPQSESLLDTISPEHFEDISKAMQATVHGIRGTAREIANGSDYRIAGKTGTAQVFGQTYDPENPEERVKVEDLAEHLRHHALFIGFAPADEPKIAIAVVAEHGGGGSTVAAPIARKVLDAWLKERTP